MGAIVDSARSGTLLAAKDSFSGYYKFGARYYDPTLGRWTQMDPSGQDANSYAYAGSNPVNFVYPSGLSFWSSASRFYKNATNSAAFRILWRLTGIALSAASIAGGGGVLIPLSLAYLTINLPIECIDTSRARCFLAGTSALLGVGGVVAAIRSVSVARDIGHLPGGSAVGLGLASAIAGNYACGSRPEYYTNC
ncbi:MAG: RHS repeat-associated core domain-containing protein [Actinomycetota bacterium]